MMTETKEKLAPNESLKFLYKAPGWQFVIEGRYGGLRGEKEWCAETLDGAYALAKKTIDGLN